MTESAPIPSTVVVTFAGAPEADRRIAGVAAAARIARELAEAGFLAVWLSTATGEDLAEATMEDVRRLASPMRVGVGQPPANERVCRLAGDRLIPAPIIARFLRGDREAHEAAIALDRPGADREVLRRTGKADDGVVSRALNRPISRRVSAILLRLPGTRPVHATIGTALLAVLMFAFLVGGGKGDLIVGALLFQAASVFDGVDGEIARATFRTSRRGAALDSAVDMATNVAAMLGLAINLAERGHRQALPLVAFGLTLLLLGLAMIGWRSLRRDGTMTFDGVKHEFRGRTFHPLASRMMTLATLGTSRDFCALVYLVLVLAGIPMAGLYLFAMVTPVWIVFVAAALWPRRSAPQLTPEGAR